MSGMDPSLSDQLNSAAFGVVIWLIVIGSFSIAIGGTFVAIIVRLLFPPRRPSREIPNRWG